MNIPDTFRILFKKAVKEQDVEFADITHKDCTRHGFDANSIFEEILKNDLLNMSNSPNLTTTQQFIQFSIEIAKKSLIGTHMPALLLKELFSVMPLDKCKDSFILLENNIETWKDDAFFKNSKTILLLLCNNLLSRLSVVDQANIRGRILIFLAKILPFYERSGCNVDNECNTEYLLVKSENLFDINKELDIDVNFDNFKLLQKYLMDPDKCVTKEHWDTFMLSTTYVLNFFIDNEVKEAQSPITVSQLCGKIELTNNLLGASVYDCTFRRELLVQMLMIYQHLNSKVLAMEQLKAIKKNTVTIYKILETMPPDGQKFVTIIKNIVQREERWSAWKSAGCPELPKPASQKLNFRNIPAKRQLGDIWKEKIFGNKCSLKTVSPPGTTTLEDCKRKERNFFPTLTSYLREAAEELSLDSTIAERNKKIYDGDFGWKAIRLMAKRSNRFFDYQKEPMANRSEFLKMMILKVLDAELDSAEVTDDELLDDACASTIQVPITNSEFEALFGTLGEDWKLLATKLGFTENEIESIEVPNPTPSRRASCILRSWFEGPNNPTIEYFCSVMDSIGHSEISQLIKINYLPSDEKNEKAIEEKLQLQDTSNSPKSLIDISDDEPECSDGALHTDKMT